MILCRLHGKLTLSNLGLERLVVAT